MKLTKKQQEYIKDAYNRACSDWKQEIKENFPKLFKEDDFKAGDYFYSLDNWPYTVENKVFKIREISYGEYLYPCNETFKGTSESCNQHISSARKATPEEIQSALQKEAERRGFVAGNFKCIYSPRTIKNKEGNYFYWQDEDVLWIGGNACYEKGKWAEIIPTITKKEAEEKLNVKII